MKFDIKQVTIDIISIDGKEVAGKWYRANEAIQAYSMPPEYVVLLHGLARTSSSMNALETFLSEQGYEVLNIDYPSRKYQI